MPHVRLILLVGFLLVCSLVQAEQIGSAFSYQGELQQSGVPADGTFDFHFDLYDVETMGSPVAASVFVDDVVVTEGIFTVVLDFGTAVFADEKLYLEIGVRDGAAGGDYTTVSPRQIISPKPFVLQSQSVPDGSITGAQIDPTSVQARISGICESGNVVRAINQDGSVVCEPSSMACSVGVCDEVKDTATLTCGSASTLVNCIVQGKVWIAHPASDESSAWQSVTHGNGLFVAVSSGPGARVMTSTDGVYWISRDAFPINDWTDVTHGGGLFVAVSDSGGAPQVLTSPDGINWTDRMAAANEAWQSVTFGDGLFVAVSNSGVNRVMTSPDGIAWTARTAAELNAWTSVTFGNGLFVAVSESGSNRVMTSPDGITWTARAASDPIDWQSVSHGKGLFVAVSDTASDRVMTSDDAINWTGRSVPELNAWSSVTYGDGLFVAVSRTGTNRVMTSPDGITWTPRLAAEPNIWVSVTYADGLFVAVSVNGVNRVMTAQWGL